MKSPAFPTPPSASSSSVRVALVTAKIMIRWPSGATAKQLQDAFGMSRAQAFRYLAAIKEARAAA